MQALIVAIQDGDEDKVADILLDPEVDVDGIEDAMTPLLWACQLSQAPVVRALIARGADANLAAEEGESPLHVAAAEGCAECAAILLVAGAAVDARTDLGKTPLMDSAHAGTNAVLAMLLDAGADVNATDENGRTPLHWAAAGAHDSPDVVRHLLAAGADRSRQTMLGDTALDYARALEKSAIEHALTAD